jgi:putative ABC transport system substrate-binding protein
MDRRALLHFGLSFLPGPVAAQTAAKVPRVGILTPAGNDRTPVFAAFRDGLRDLGYVDGRSIVLDYRFAQGDFSVFPRLAADLVTSAVDVIVTDGGIAVALAAARATQTIPIIVATIGDPVTQGLVASIARPGGNVTGFTVLSPELAAKRLDLLRSAFPQAKSVALLFNPASGNTEILRLTEEASKSLGFVVILIEADSPKALRALPPDALSRAEAVIVLADGMFWNQRGEILRMIGSARLPAVYPERQYADDGGLIAYGPNVPDIFRRVAGYIDRILKGAKPGDLPFQQPTKFDFIVNLKAARTLGVILSPDLIARADEIIE